MRHAPGTPRYQRGTQKATTRHRGPAETNKHEKPGTASKYHHRKTADTPGNTRTPGNHREHMVTRKEQGPRGTRVNPGRHGGDQQETRGHCGKWLQRRRTREQSGNTRDTRDTALTLGKRVQRSKREHGRPRRETMAKEGHHGPGIEHLMCPQAPPSERGRYGPDRKTIQVENES